MSGKVKKFFFISLTFILWAAPSSAETYISPFGFKINLASHWFIISGPKIKNNPSLLVTAETEIIRKCGKDALFDFVLEDSKKGTTEYYINTKTCDEVVNNIIVVKHNGRFPKGSDEVGVYCANFKQNGSKQYGENFKIKQCSQIKINNLNIIYKEYQVIALQCIQYLIEKNDNEVIDISISYYDQTSDEIKTELEYIISSFNWTKIKSDTVPIGNKTKKVSSKDSIKGKPKSPLNEQGHTNPPNMAVFATCFWVGIATGYIAKKKKKSFWKWGALGFFIFGPGLYIGVIIAVAFIAGISR